MKFDLKRRDEQDVAVCDDVTTRRCDISVTSVWKSYQKTEIKSIQKCISSKSKSLSRLIVSVASSDIPVFISDADVLFYVFILSDYSHIRVLIVRTEINLILVFIISYRSFSSYY